MTMLELLFVAGAVGAVGFMALVAAGRSGMGNWVVAVMLAAGFMAFSLVPIITEGPLVVVANHTANFWGAQVWLDLLFALGSAVFLAAPRARRVGMAIGPWLILVVLLGSIGLFVLLARLFWLEQNTSAKA